MIRVYGYCLALITLKLQQRLWSWLNIKHGNAASTQIVEQSFPICFAQHLSRDRETTKGVRTTKTPWTRENYWIMQISHPLALQRSLLRTQGPSVMSWTLNVLYSIVYKNDAYKS